MSKCACVILFFCLSEAYHSSYLSVMTSRSTYPYVQFSLPVICMSTYVCLSACFAVLLCDHPGSTLVELVGSGGSGTRRDVLGASIIRLCNGRPRRHVDPPGSSPLPCSSLSVRRFVRPRVRRSAGRLWRSIPLVINY